MKNVDSYLDITDLEMNNLSVHKRSAMRMGATHDHSLAIGINDFIFASREFRRSSAHSIGRTRI